MVSEIKALATLPFAVLLLLALLPRAGRAVELNLAALSCEQYENEVLTSKLPGYGADSIDTVMWLFGFATARSGERVMYGDSLRAFGFALDAVCKNEPNRMLLDAVTGITSKRENPMDLTRLDCATFEPRHANLRLSDPQNATTLTMWMYGYAAGRAGSHILDPGALTRFDAGLNDHCSKHPADSVYDALNAPNPAVPRSGAPQDAAAAAAGAVANEPALARDRRLELPTPYVPPPGNPLEHHAAGLAQIMCSAVFITGLDPDFAAENVGYFTAPYAERAKLGKPIIDRQAKTVSVAVPGDITRVAQYIGDQGCITFEPNKTQPEYTPHAVPRPTSDPATLPWPDGDAPDAAPGIPATPAAPAAPAAPAPAPHEAAPRDRASYDAALVAQAVDAAFASPAGLTAAFVVTWRGRIIAERYAPGITLHTPLESWSMGKSVTASLMGVLIGRGDYQLMERAPIPQWRTPGDPRSHIRIADLLHMSSGLRIRAPYDPDYDPQGPYPDHLYLYTGSVNSFHYAATRPLEWPPNTVGRYRNTDPVLVNYLIRLAVEARGEDYLSFPQRALFDKLGIRSMVIETDPFGDLLTQGYDLASARDWARLGNLYLQDGVWKGERLLPKGFVDFVRTPAPAWLADHKPVYGGFFWINGDGAMPIPKDSYYMAGAGGQYTVIIPSHDLVVVRLGHFKGDEIGSRDLNKALGVLVRAVPQHHRPDALHSL